MLYESSQEQTVDHPNWRIYLQEVKMKTAHGIILSCFFVFLFNSNALAKEGCLRGDCYNGHGTYEWESGNQYTGTFKNGSRNGQGVFTFANGDKYIGEFKNSTREGIGVYFYSDGSKYEGEYVNNERTGFGIFTLTNGARYEGEYLNGEKHGFGKFIFPDGKVMNGNWESGKFIEPDAGVNYSNDPMAAGYYLTINPLPADSTIRFLDSSLVYKPRMKLAPGRYKVEVSRPNYNTKIEYIDIYNRNIIVPVTLRIANEQTVLNKIKGLFFKKETAPSGSGERSLTRGMELERKDATFDSAFVESMKKPSIDDEYNRIKEQRVNTALDESENAQKLSMIEQLKQEIEMLKASYAEPALVSIKNLPDSNTRFDRVALVIGNSQYPFIGQLKNPENDAKDMAEALRKLGFNVTVKLNADQEEMEAAIGEFGKLLKEDSLGLFYYAGHGVQIKGNNYLIPVHSGIKQAKDIRYKAVDLNMLIDEMVYANNGKNIIILDACRNNPLPEKDERRSSTGLARTDAPAGTLIAYATSPGSVAIDGEGRNGVYTKYLLENMFEPGIPIEIVFKRVLQGVSSDTNRKQIPWMSSSLDIDFYFITKNTDNIMKNIPTMRTGIVSTDIAAN